VRLPEPDRRRTAVLVDQHPLWLDAVECVLRRIAIDVAARTTSADEVLPLVHEHRPDVLVAETQTIDGDGSFRDAVREALATHPSLKVVALSISADRADIDAAFAAGALAYIVKTSHPDDIASGIRQAFERSVYLPDRREFLGGSKHRLREAAGGRDAVRLTRREIEILEVVAQGHSNGQLARMLWVTEQTVKFHLSNVYRKLGVTNRTEASRCAYAYKVLDAQAGKAVGEQSSSPVSRARRARRPHLELAPAPTSQNARKPAGPVAMRERVQKRRAE
jgi:DNA-binding NarL/FixJ family response regulator